MADRQVLESFKLELGKGLTLGRSSASANAKALIVLGITVAGVLILAEATRRRRRRSKKVAVEHFGAFVERFELPPSPQPPPPAARHTLADLKFAISDNFEIKDYVAGYGNPDWQRTHEPASRTAVVVSMLLKHGATCVGRTVMDELAFGVTGDNSHYGSPINPELPSLAAGGSSSGSAVAVAAELVDFALGMRDQEIEDRQVLESFKLELGKGLTLGRSSASANAKALIVLGITVAGVLILAEATRRRRRRSKKVAVEHFGAFVERFELPPSPQPPPPAARHTLADLKFAISDNFEIKDYVAGYGNPDWQRTHEPASRTAVVVSMLLKHGATCVGRTVMDELAFGVTGDNLHYGSPINPELPSLAAGGSSSGSAVAVAAELVDFALGTDTVGGVRIPASFCGILGFRPSHGVVSTIGVLTNSQSLDTIGWFARDPSILHCVGHILLQSSSVGLKRTRRFILADDCFQFLRVPMQKTVHVLSKAIENLSGYQPMKHMNIGQYIMTNVLSLKEFVEPSTKKQLCTSTLKAISSAMLLLQRCEFKTNHEEWINTVKPRIGIDISAHVLAAVNSTHENMKSLYKVRIEMRNALNTLLKDDGILIIPTVTDFPFKRDSKKKMIREIEDRLYTLLSIAGMSGCCQVTIPLGKHEDYPISISYIAAHGADKFLLDTVLDMYPSLQEQITIASNLDPAPDINGDMDAAELLKEKGNAAYKGKQWNKAVSFYSEAIKLNNANATYYCNRAAAYLELGCFQQAEADCNQALSFDKKNVKAYMRRGTSREMLLCYKEALQDFKHALVLEPQNKTALAAEKRLRKLVG
ncbi:outer envelope protein 64, mitochondrial [Canna indica]|uniref:Outer envelope protein 64, mitochondrial n=1 Tax=Canna indica TaxID=4628 RepID=A0AAQ3KVC2_9LILI|nr:outer envelope protein 64, mitochondrial [Canna indica]